MHILFIPSWYPSASNRLNGVFFKDFAEEIQKKGHKIGVLSIDMHSLKSSNASGFIPKIRCSLDNNIKLYQYSTANFFPKLHPVIAWYWKCIGLSLFRKYVKENGLPDIIHVQSSIYASFIAKKIKDKYGINFIVTEHCSAFQRNVISSVSSKYILKQNSSASRLLAVSYSLTNYLNGYKYVNKEWFTINNMVNNVFFTSDYDNFILNQESNSKFFLVVGNLNSNKNISLSIRAFSLFQKENKDFKLYIIGDGVEYTKLNLLVAQLNLEESVVFLGSQDALSVKTYMFLAEALLISSVKETFGLVAAESLAVGTPVISTRCGGTLDIINKEVGFICEYNEISMFEAMLEIKRKNFDSKAIMDYAYLNFSPEIISKKYEKLYFEYAK